MLVRTLQVTALAIAVSLGLVGAGVAVAAPPTANATTTAEYNTYVYTFSARSTVLNMPNAIQNQYNSTTSSTLRAQLATEKFLCELLVISVERAFEHALVALTENDDSQWSACQQDLTSAIYACDTLLDFQADMTSPNQKRVQAIQSCRSFLVIAKSNCEVAANAWFMNLINGNFNIRK